MRFARHDHADERDLLPMTSLIDVVFLLLIYFMVTASFTARENDLASALRADEQGTGRASDLLPQILSVELAGDAVVYRIGERALSDRASLVEMLSRLNKDMGVFVKASNVVPIEATATALQSCTDAGFVKVTYVPTS